MPCSFLHRKWCYIRVQIISFFFFSFKKKKKKRLLGISHSQIRLIKHHMWPSMSKWSTLREKSIMRFSACSNRHYLRTFWHQKHCHAIFPSKVMAGLKSKCLTTLNVHYQVLDIQSFWFVYKPWQKQTINGVYVKVYLGSLLKIYYFDHLTHLCPLGSCGPRFLAPRPRNTPLSFAPTQTGLKNVSFMALTLDRPDYILHGKDWTETIYLQPKITGELHS